jgi:hypothetical protein
MAHAIVPPYLLARIAAVQEPTWAKAAEAARSTLAAPREYRPVRSRLRLSIEDDGTLVAEATPAPDREISDAQQKEQLPGVKVRGEDDPATGDGEVFSGFTRSLTVIAHELAHGVIEDEGGLLYRGQSGALNESIADVVGALAEQHHLGQTADQASWLIGEGIFTDAVEGRALRSMAAPGTAYDDDVLGRDPQPAHMRDFVVTRDDNGGVHINSGIPNHAFYLVATALGGHAWERAGLIWYRALTGALPSTADFSTFANATLAAAAAEYGEESEEVAAVRAAWTSVGVIDDARAAETAA